MLNGVWVRKKSPESRESVNYDILARYSQYSVLIKTKKAKTILICDALMKTRGSVI